MPNYPDRRPSDEREAKARAESPVVELNILLDFHGLQEYHPYISIEDAEFPNYRIESDDEQQSYVGSVWLTPYNPKLYWIASGWTTNEQGEKAEFHRDITLIPGKTRYSICLRSFGTTDSPLTVNGQSGRIRAKAWKSANVFCAPR